VKAVIMAGGYGVRLYPLTKYIPKALLPVAGKPVIDYQVEQLAKIYDIDEIVVSTNAYFEDQFRYWWLRLPKRVRTITRLAIEPSLRESQKMGSIKGLVYTIDEKSLANNDLLVTAGDNLFDFQIQGLVNAFIHHDEPTVVFYDFKDFSGVNGKYGVGILSEEGTIASFYEKPTIPISTLVSIGCYAFPASVIDYLRGYVKQTVNLDTFGQFIAWYSQQVNVHAFISSGRWFDIGTIESYEDAINYYSRRNGEVVV